MIKNEPSIGDQVTADGATPPAGDGVAAPSPFTSVSLSDDVLSSNDDKTNANFAVDSDGNFVLGRNGQPKRKPGRKPGSVGSPAVAQTATQKIGNEGATT